MKKIFAALLSASFMMSPVVVSQASAAPRHATVEKNEGFSHRHWSKGYRLSPAERRRMADVHDYRRYHLRAPPRGYRWVRVDNDYLLVGITSGIISSFIAASR